MLGRRAFLTGALPALVGGAILLPVDAALAATVDGGQLVVNGVLYDVVMTPAGVVATPTPAATLVPTAVPSPTATPTPSSGLPMYSLANKGPMSVDQYFAFVSGQKPQGGFELFIPAGTWNHSGVLMFQNMSNIRIYGVGEASNLRATNFGAAALRLRNCSKATLENFQVSHNNPTQRLDPPDSAGVHIHGVTDSVFKNMWIATTASAGMWSELQATSTVPRFCERLTFENITVRKTLSDGIHTTNGAKDVLVKKCNFFDTGDDSCSFINYTGSPRQIENCWSEDCYAESNGVGVGNHFSMEGAKDSGFRNPTSKRSRTAPIRFAAMGQWSRIENNNVQCLGGLVEDGRSSGAGHPGGVLVYAGAADQINVTVDGLKIIRPNNWVAIQSNGETTFRVRGLNLLDVDVERQGKLICQGFGQFSDTDNLVKVNCHFDGGNVAFLNPEFLPEAWQAYIPADFDGLLAA